MNPLVSTVELTGEEIKYLLEDNIERTFSCYPIQQMGGYLKRCFGITAYIKIKNRKGARIQELFIGGIHYARNKSYKAAFVTEQGVPHHVGKNREHTAIRAVDAMADFLKKNLLDLSILNNQAFIIV